MTLIRTSIAPVLAVAVLAASAATGSNPTPLQGTVGSKTVQPGTYRAAVLATDATGNRPAARYVRFRVAH
jgi:hypothetical protein